jgi:hypothetical protein
MRLPLLALAAMLASGSVAVAATPSPPPPRIDVTKIQPKALLPKTKLHTEYIVEINRYGQVARVRSGKRCPNASFNAQTYGNALQAFIRTPDGRAIPGSYRLTYDYDPRTERVRRDVALVHAGGVNPNAKGAALTLLEVAKKHSRDVSQPEGAAPAPAPSVNVKRLPDLPQIMSTPHPHA